MYDIIKKLIAIHTCEVLDGASFADLRGAIVVGGPPDTCNKISVQYNNNVLGKKI